MAKYDPMTTFSKNLAKAMKHGKWTQSALADEVGIAQPDVSNLLRGKSNPTLSSMERIAEAVGLPLYQLLTPISEPRVAEKVA